MTRSCFGFTNVNGTITTVYCNDLDTDFLFESYSNVDQIKQLMQWGDLMSFTYDSIRYYNEDEFSPDYSPTFDNIEDVAKYYYECGCNSLHIFSENEWMSYTINSHDEHCYVHPARVIA